MKKILRQKDFTKKELEWIKVALITTHEILNHYDQKKFIKELLKDKFNYEII